MSGGSYDYASYQMEAGQLEKAQRYADRAAADLIEIAAEPIVEVRETEVREQDGRPYKVSVPRPVTERERTLTELAIGALAIRAKAFQSALKSCEAQARALAELFHRLEWLASGDDGIETFQEWARKWAQKQLENS